MMHAPTIEALDRLLEAAQAKDAARVTSPLVRALKAKLGRAFDALGAEFLRLLEDESGWWSLGWQGHYDQAARTTRPLFTAPLTAALRSALSAGAENVLRAVGLRDIELGAEDRRALDFLRERVASAVDGVLETTRGYVGTVVDAVRSAGGAALDAVRGIRDRFRGFLRRPEPGAASRVEAIASVEVATAFGQGQQIAGSDVKAGGLPLLKSWRTMQDERVEPECIENEAAGWVPVDDSFPAGSMYPPQHPRCRCWLVTRIAASGA